MLESRHKSRSHNWKRRLQVKSYFNKESPLYLILNKLKKKMKTGLMILVIALFLNNIAFSQNVNLQLEPYVFENQNGEKVDAELGTFEVPENRTKPNSKKLKLKFIRFKSTNPNPGAPIVYLAGGPGGSGIGSAKYARFDLFMSMRSVADVIAYDQRGTGMSDGPPEYAGFWLNDVSKPTNIIDAELRIVEETKKAAKFFKEQGTDLSGYNTNESADDLNDLRIALKAEKLNLWGISYGSHLALTTLKRHEKFIDKIIIAGVEGYDHTVKIPNDQQALMERIHDLVLADPDASKAFPNFLGDVEKLLLKLDKEPAMVKTKNPFNGSDMEVAVGKLDMQMILSWTLRGPETFVGVPLMVSSMLQGDFTSIEDYALYTHMGQFRGMSMAMDIASGISDERLVSLKKQASETLLGDMINYPFLQQQKALMHLDLGQEFRKPFPSDVPVLCISGTLDGRTDVNNAVETLEHLPNGHHLIIEGAGHSDPLFLSSPRIEEVMLDFMNGVKIEDETITLEPLRFTLPNQEK